MIPFDAQYSAELSVEVRDVTAIWQPMNARDIAVFNEESVIALALVDRKRL
jgi:hypothetical protein